MKFLQSIHDAEREPYMEFARKSMDEVGSYPRIIAQTLTAVPTPAHSFPYALN
jgi:hypothetical protein